MMKFETVKMQEGLLAALQNALTNIPSSAWGNTPSGAVVDLLQAVNSAEVLPCTADIADEEQDRPPETK